MQSTWRIENVCMCVEILEVVWHSCTGDYQRTQLETKKTVGEKEKSCNVWTAVVTLL